VLDWLVDKGYSFVAPKNDDHGSIIINLIGWPWLNYYQSNINDEYGSIFLSFFFSQLIA
jgi:hypothetical protein